MGCCKCRFGWLSYFALELVGQCLVLFVQTRQRKRWRHVVYIRSYAPRLRWKSTAKLKYWPNIPYTKARGMWWFVVFDLKYLTFFDWVSVGSEVHATFEFPCCINAVPSYSFCPVHFKLNWQSTLLTKNCPFAAFLNKPYDLPGLFQLGPHFSCRYWNPFAPFCLTMILPFDLL